MRPNPSLERRSSNRFIARLMTEPSILAAGATLSRELPNHSMQRTALRAAADAER